MKMINQVLQGLKQVAEETGKEMVDEAGKIVTGVITGAELVKDAKPMNEGEYAMKKEEDEKRKREEIKKIGRDVEKEMDEVRKEKKRKEEEEERLFLENLKKQREEEKAEMSVLEEPKGKRPRGKMGAIGKPKQSDMSATAEFSKNID